MLLSGLHIILHPCSLYWRRQQLRGGLVQNGLFWHNSLWMTRVMWKWTLGYCCPVLSDIHLYTEHHKWITKVNRTVWTVAHISAAAAEMHYTIQQIQENTHSDAVSVMFASHSGLLSITLLIWRQIETGLRSIFVGLQSLTQNGISLHNWLTPLFPRSAAWK